MQCASFNAGEGFGCCVADEYQGIIFGRCWRQATVLFHHPTEHVGHFRCDEHAAQDHVVFEKAGWLRDELGPAHVLPREGRV